MQCTNHTQFVKSNGFLLYFSEEIFTVPSSQATATGTCICWNGAPSRQCAFQVIYSSSRLGYHTIHIQILSVPDRAGGPEVEQDGRANSLATNIPRLVTTRPSILALCSIKCIESTNGGVRQANLICSSQVNAAMSQYKQENFPFHLDMSHT